MEADTKWFVMEQIGGNIPTQSIEESSLIGGSFYWKKERVLCV